MDLKQWGQTKALYTFLVVTNMRDRSSGNIYYRDLESVNSSNLCYKLFYGMLVASPSYRVAHLSTRLRILHKWNLEMPDFLEICQDVYVQMVSFTHYETDL